jgi:hypothetical protein
LGNGNFDFGEVGAEPVTNREWVQRDRILLNEKFFVNLDKVGVFEALLRLGKHRCRFLITELLDNI